MAAPVPPIFGFILFNYYLLITYSSPQCQAGSCQPLLHLRAGFWRWEQSFKRENTKNPSLFRPGACLEHFLQAGGHTKATRSLNKGLRSSLAARVAREINNDLQNLSPRGPKSCKARGWDPGRDCIIPTAEVLAPGKSPKIPPKTHPGTAGLGLQPQNPQQNLLL